MKKGQAPFYQSSWSLRCSETESDFDPDGVCSVTVS